MPPNPVPADIPAEAGGYLVGRRIGSGSFGDVFHGRKDNEEFAVKMEPLTAKRAQLLEEWKFYTTLAGGEGIPRVYWFGQVGNYSVLVMELLGASLEDLFKRHGKAFSTKTVFMLAHQILQRIEYVHSKGILHKDIKPNNFLIGRGANASRIYIIDFGLSRSYLERKTKKHVAYSEGRSGLTGTARYTSINNHMGRELSRRDDLEGIGYVLVRMLSGTLPWQGMKGETKKLRNEKIHATKEKITVEELCQGFPRQLAQFLSASQGLGFYEEPAYGDYRRLMEQALEQNGYAYDLAFDWCAEKGSGSEDDAPGPVEVVEDAAMPDANEAAGSANRERKPHKARSFKIVNSRSAVCG